MAHLSENSNKLKQNVTVVYQLSQLENLDISHKSVYFFWLPSGRSYETAKYSESFFHEIVLFCNRLPQEAVVCILTTAPDAALFIPYLETALKFQLWVAVKTSEVTFNSSQESIPQHHAALIILSRYQGSLIHTKTRIGYTYCPACHKTTKDYGGKKHTYHEYGTLVSDIWRDIVCDSKHNIAPVLDRLSDLFGLPPYEAMHVIDLRSCKNLYDRDKRKTLLEQCLPIIWEEKGLPINSQLLNQDVIEGLKSLPDNSLDFCFTDPPYNIQKKYDKWNDSLESVEYFRWCDHWLTELYRVLKPGRTLAILNIPLWAVRHFQHLSSMMDYQAWIVWEGLSLPVRMIMPAHYAIICFTKGRSRPLPGLTSPTEEELNFLQPLSNFYCLRTSCTSKRNLKTVIDKTEISDLWSDVHRLKHNSRRVDHPCQLPPMLMRRLFALFTRPGETILDCFDGAGTSTLVAHQMKRNFIGIELSSHYHALAIMRHEQISRGEDPFGKSETVPTVKNSRVQRVTKQQYEVSKKELQLDIKRIAQILGHLPTHEEVEQMSNYAIRYYDQYFASWGEVCAAARTTGMLERQPQNMSTQENYILTQQLTLAIE